MAFSEIEAGVLAPAASVLVDDATTITFVVEVACERAVTAVSFLPAKCSVTRPTMLAAGQAPEPAEHLNATLSLLFAPPIAPTERAE